MSAWECYGVRRLSPFRGVMQVFAARGAVTVDRAHWPLQRATGGLYCGSAASAIPIAGGEVRRAACFAELVVRERWADPRLAALVCDGHATGAAVAHAFGLGRRYPPTVGTRRAPKCCGALQVSSLVSGSSGSRRDECGTRGIDDATGLARVTNTRD